MEVICQLRFPPILRIEAEPPASFQERIRLEYPLLQDKTPETGIELPPDIPPVVAEMLRTAMSKRKLRIGYDFISADEKWKVALTTDFIALTTARYGRWEEFRPHIDPPLKALIEVYAPAFFTRIGLRYRDLIRRSQLGLSNSAWSSLLRPHISGVLASPELAGAEVETFNQVLIKFPHNRGQVQIRHGLVQAVDNNEECYLIDSDFYTDKRTGINDVDDILSYFNRQSGRLFRWCIEERLHQAMEPDTVEAPT
jgi:uncharacterized protein (TIGR04255 family)